MARPAGRRARATRVKKAKVGRTRGAQMARDGTSTSRRARATPKAKREPVAREKEGKEQPKAESMEARGSADGKKWFAV